jgi:YebC/PmpR family DNA-binding regulatory protein
MSGHSKWKTIKHKKAATDAKKSKQFSKLIREIEVCARASGGDLAGNATLKTLMDKAREINMPLENAQRAVKKGTGELAGEAYEAQTYEGYGPHNVAVVIETLTSNKNRTISELRHVFNRHNSIIAAPGAVNWLFERKGVITIANDGSQNEDSLMELLLEYPVDSINVDEEIITVIGDPKALEDEKHALKNATITVQDAQIEWVAKAAHTIEEKHMDSATDFLEALEELDDVQNVYTNLA